LSFQPFVSSHSFFLPFLNIFIAPFHYVLIY
jgi:hypothetical protein